MDRDRFDSFTRMLSTKGSRRGALGATLGAILFHRGVPVVVAAGKSRGKGHDEGKGKGHGNGHGHGHDNDKLCQDLACEKLPVPQGAHREFCCKGGYCSCGGRCCPNEECFQTGDEQNPSRVFCCTRPKHAICAVPTGSSVPGEEFVDTCCERNCDACGAPGPSGIAGSYRRR